MAQKKKEQEDVHLENVQEALSKSEAFIEQYRKQLVIGVAVVVAVVVAVILFNTYYLAPREQEAQEALLPAVAAFENDQYEVALRGDESFDGFEAIVDEYGLTDAGELAAYYAGVCAYQLGEYEVAVDYLGKFDNASVNLAPAARMLQGDAYCNLEEYKKAAKCFEKAADSESALVAPRALKKAGLAYEALGDYAKAVKAYTTIKEKYFQSQEAADIEKYIVRAAALDK